MKRLRGFLLGIVTLFMGVSIATTPVFAEPDTTPTTPETTEVTTPETETEGEGEDSEEPAEVLTCAEQVDRLAWLVCPGTGLLANIIDGAYNILTYLIKIDPLPSDADSPFHLIWTYCRNLTNIVFIFVLLVCILSQITGMGISNVGIKRMLPRLIVIVIASNLSYIICQIAVDLSNIIGAGLSGVFELVQNQAIASGAISLELSEVGAGTIISHFLGIGAAVVGIGTILANIGGFAGLIWLILPVILSGVFAVISAVLTMAARQSLIYLLVMISPVAIVAYALPNTESWARKWYSLFMRMLFFYPMFAVLYSASRLAGLVIMSTATGMDDDTQKAITIVLGVAVQLIPLFMSIPMMRMSGTILGKISGIVGRISAPATKSFGGMAVERRKHAIESLRRSNSPWLHTHMARYLQQRKTDRINEIKELEGINRDTYERRYVQGYYNNRGQLTRRGAMHYSIAADKVQNARIVKDIDTDFDKGFSTDAGAISDRVSARRYRQIREANEKLATELDLTEIANARADLVRRDNIENRAIHLRDTIRGESGDSEADRQIRRLVNNSFQVTNEHEQTDARNAVLARAINQKRKVDTERRSEYLELYKDYPAGDLIKQALNQAFVNHDYNSLEAATQVMTERGDQNWILEEMEKNSRHMYIDPAAPQNVQNEMVRFQKHLLDSILPLKNDDIFVAAWSKANMIRRAKHEMGKNVAGFISWKDFINGVTIEGEDPEEAAKLSATAIINSYSSGEYFMSQDRTVFDQMLTFKVKRDPELGEAIVRDDLVLFREKDIRSGLASGKMDGEQLDNALDYFTNGYFKSHDMSKTTSERKAKYVAGAAKAEFADFAEAHMGTWQALTDDDGNVLTNDDGSVKMGYENGSTLKFIYDMLAGMTAKQIATSKSTTFKMLNHIVGVYGRQGLGFTPDGYSLELRSLLSAQIAALNEANAAALRDAMNPDIRKILGVVGPTRRP